MKVREYFYGPPSTKLCPHSIIVKFDEVVICEIGGGLSAPKSTLPIGMTTSVNPCAIVSCFTSTIYCF